MGTLHHVIIRGIELGSQPNLVCGELVQSLEAGWSQVKALERIGYRELFDERVLGSGVSIEALRNGIRRYP